MILLIAACTYDPKPKTEYEACVTEASDMATHHRMVITHSYDPNTHATRPHFTSVPYTDEGEFTLLVRKCEGMDDTPPRPCGPDPKGKDRQWWCYR